MSGRSVLLRSLLSRAAMLVLAVTLVACGSWRGARLYTHGSQALERGETGRAIAELEQAATLLPEVSEVHNHLGLAYAAADRQEDALRAFRHAVALECSNDAAQANLAAAEAWLQDTQPTSRADALPPLR